MYPLFLERIAFMTGKNKIGALCVWTTNKINNFSLPTEHKRANRVHFGLTHIHTMRLSNTMFLILAHRFQCPYSSRGHHLRQDQELNSYFSAFTKWPPSERHVFFVYISLHRRAHTHIYKNPKYYTPMQYAQSVSVL